MTRQFRLQSILVTVVIASLLTSEVAAEDFAGTAEALFREGREELTAGKFESACSKLRQSDALDPAPGTKLNLAECEVLRGHVATGWELFRLVEQQLLPGDVRLPIARAKREAVEPRLPRLLITLAADAPADTRVQVGDRELGPDALGQPLVLDPGRFELRVTAAGHAENRVLVTLKEGTTTRVAVAPPRAKSEAVPKPATPSRDRTPAAANPTVDTSNTAPAPPESTSPHRAAKLLLTLGITGAAVSVVTGVLTLDAKRINQEHCDSESHSCDQIARDAASRGRVFGTVTTIGMVTGAVGIGLGTYLLIYRGNEARTATHLQVRGSASAAELGIEGTF